MKNRISKIVWALVLPLAVLLAPAGRAAGRVVRAADLTVARGQTNAMAVLLEAPGDENTVAFSLCFDTNLLTFVKAARGADGTNAGAALTVNADEVAEGRVGLSLVLPVGQTFAADSTNAIVEVCFRGAWVASSTTVAVASCETPVPRAVLDTNGTPLAAGYVDATVTVTGCAYSLATNALAAGAGASTNDVGVTTDGDCDWTAASTNGWITILSGASSTGSGTVSFALAANPAGLARSGVVVMAGENFTVSQAAAECTFGLSAAGGSFGSGATNGTVDVTTLAGCEWVVANSNGWITITSATNATNSGTVSFTLAANPAGLARSGVVVMAGENFTVSQAAAECTFGLSAAGGGFGSGATNGTVDVTTLAGCEWVVANSNGWITITSATNATNSGTVSFTLAANPAGLGRSGVVVMAGENFTVSQAAAECTFGLSAAGGSFGSGATNGTVDVTTLAGCEWVVANSNGWITITSATNATNSGTVSFTLAANPAGLARSGVVVMAGENFTVSQAAAECTFGLSAAGGGFGSGATNGTVDVTTLAGCEWVVANSNGWITITSATNATNSGTVSFTLAANPAGLGRSGVVVMAGENFTVSQAAAECTFGLSAAGGSFGSGATNGTVDVTTLAGCEWVVANSNGWITITSATNATNSGTVSFALAANPAGLARSGVVVMAGENFTVSQAAAECTFGLSAAGGSFGSGATNGTVDVTTLAGCEWTVANSNGWITITSATNATNSGTVSFALAVNPAGLPRSGVVVMAGENFTVSQAAAECTFGLSAAGGSFGSGATNGTVDVTTLAGCEWVVANSNGWITITSATNATNSGTVSFALAVNPAGLPRSGVVVMAGENFTVSQAAAECTFGLSAAGGSFGSGATNGTVDVTTLAGCEWVVANSNGWITITSATNATNSGTVSFALAANPAGLGRSGVVVMAGENFTVSQAAAECTFGLSAAGGSFGSGATNGTVDVTTLAGCEWVVANSNGWITITSATNATNSGTVSFALAANPAGLARSGVVVMAGQNFTVSQAAAECTFGLSAAGGSFGSGATNGTVDVTTLAGCEWVVANSNGWITITSATNATNSGTVSFALAANPAGLGRSGVVVMAGENFTVSQAAAECTFGLSAAGGSFGSGATNGTVDVTTLAGCEWVVANSNGWITITSATNATNSGTVSFTLAANPAGLGRSGVVVMAGENFTVSQAAAECTFGLSAAGGSFGSGATNGTVDVTTLAGCEWVVANSNGWITITSATNATNSGTVSFALAANPAGLARSGVVVMAGENFTVNQAAAGCNYALSANSASHLFGGGTGLVSVTTLTGCVWSASASNSWITLTATGSATNSGSVGYTVASNNTGLARSTVLTIAGHSFTVNQDPAPCTYALSASGTNHLFGGGTGLVSVTTLTGCVWSASATNSWITFTTATNGTNGGSVGYAVASNTTGLARSSVLTIAGRSFTVNQDPAPCTYALSVSGTNHLFGGGTGLVSVTTLTGCVWSASATNPWITFTTATNATNSGSVGYAVASNTTGLARSSVLTVAGQSFTVTQDAAPCAYTLSASSASHLFGGGTGLVSVTTLTGCAWSASATNPWITFTSATNGTNSGSVGYAVASNTTGLARSSVLTIAGHSFTVNQDPVPCTYALSANSASHLFGGGTGLVSVTTLTGCAWSASATNSWITFTTATNGTNSGSVGYAVASNTTGLARSSVLTIAGHSFTVNQDPAPCTYALSVSGTNHLFGGGTGLVSVTTLTGCVWSASATNPWITFTTATNATNSGSVGYAVASNTTGLARSSVLTVAGQSFTVTQDAAPCAYTLSASSASHLFGGGTGLVSVTTLTGCAWSASATNPWITFTSATNGTNSGSVGYAVASNTTGLARSSVLTIAGHSFTVNQDPVPCTYALSANSASHLFGGGTGLVSVTTLTGCAWSASATNPWITFTSATNGTNSGSVGYAVASNTTGLARSSVLTIAGHSFTVNQDPVPCTYALSANSASHLFGGGTGLVSVTTLTGCAWSASATNSWITFTTATNGTNSGSVGYAVASNTTGAARSGVITMANRAFTVTQDGVPCTLAIFPTNWVHRPASDTGIVSVTTITGCSWGVTNTNSWITITSGANGTGSGSVTYDVAANASANERAGVLAIAGQLYFVSQPGTACGYRLSPTNRPHGFGATSNTVMMTASNGCAWSVINTNGWITIVSNAVGSGTATVGYGVTRNSNPNPRFGVVNIGGEILTLTQWGTNCGFTIAPVSRAHGSGAETGQVSVAASTAGCAWSTANTNAWITITAGASGTGAGSMGYALQANPEIVARSGVFTVAGLTYTVFQAGIPCAYTLSETSKVHGAGMETGLVGVTATNGCPWSVTNANNWITITSGASGTNSGNVSYTVAANLIGAARTGLVMIADQTLTVVQAGAPCFFALTPAARHHTFGAATGSVDVAVLTGCSWMPSINVPWLTIASGLSGTGTGSVVYVAAANPTGVARTGLVSVADQVFTVSQDAAPCFYTIGTNYVAHGFGMETGLVTVASPNGCAWSAFSSNSWITITSGANGAGSNSVGYAVEANTTAAGRTGVVNVAGQILRVGQAGVPCTFALLPTSRSHGSGMETGTVSVTTASGCHWTVANSNAWITIIAGTSGSGTGSVTYTVTSNALPAQRTGVVTVQGQPFTVSQAGFTCAFALDATNRLHGPGPDTGAVNVTTSAACSWTVANTNPWITVTSPTNFTGNGSVSYSVATNAGGSRSGNLLVAGLPFAVSQGGSIRLIRAVDLTIPRGQTNRLAVVLEGKGDENGVGFSVCYDTNLLTFLSFTRLVASGGFQSNTNTRGRLGFGWSLDLSDAFPAGQNTMVQISFRAAPGTNFTTTPVTLCDAPVFRQVVDALATELETSYSNATVALLGVCTYALGTNAAAFAASGGAGAVAVVTPGVGCAWGVTNTNAWITITSGASGAGPGSVGFSVAANALAAARTGVLIIAGQTFTVSQAGAPCTFTLTPSGAAHGSGSEPGAIGVGTLDGCAWTASTTNSWITFPSGTNGSGGGSLSYRVEANASVLARTGSVLVVNQPFIVTQAGAPCLFALSATNGAHGSGTETGGVTVTTISGCSWGVTNTNAWITITSATNFSGTSAVNYRVAVNASLSGRAGVVMIAGQAFTVNQAGAACAYTVSPTNGTHSFAAATNTFSVGASSNGCSWSVMNTNPWIVIVSGASGTGNDSVTYRVTVNLSGLGRTGVVSVAGQPFTVIQGGVPCDYSIAPTERTHGPGADSGQVSVATFTGCPWTASSTNSWITITMGASGVGLGAVSYAVAANPNGFGRTGVLTIAGQSYTVSQDAAPCTFALTPASRHHTSGTNASSFNVTTLNGCAWSVSNSASWITITSSTNGTGSNSVSYSVTANPTGLARTGLVSVAHQVFTVSQDGAACNYTLSTNGAVCGFGGTTGLVSVTALSGCSWSASNGHGWITFPLGANGSGTGSVVYVVAANPTGLARTGLVSLASQMFTVSQAGAPCTYVISTNAAAHGFGTETGLVNVVSLSGCPWTVFHTNSWIAINSGQGGTNSAGVGYTVAANPSALARTGVVSVANQIFTIRQAPAPCTFALSTNAVAYAPAGATGLVTVTTLTGCPWGVTTTNSWITITSAASGTNNGTVNYTVAANPTTLERAGAVVIGDQLLLVTQAGIACTYMISPNSGTHVSGNVTGLVSVAALPGCNWVTINTNPWIAIKNGATGTSTGLVRYTVAANPNPSVRSGFIVVAGQPFQVTQVGSPCTYSLSPTGRVHFSMTETGIFSVLPASPECGWTVTHTNPWITITSLTNGLGNGSVGYALAENPGSADRTGVLLVGGSPSSQQPYVITQLGSLCQFTLLPSNRLHGAVSETGTVSVTTLSECTWAVRTNASWITLLSPTNGLGTGLVSYAVAPNFSPQARTGAVFIGTATFPVTQAGILCTFAVTPSNLVHGYQMETGMVSVATSNLCPWSVSTTNAWILFTAGTNRLGNTNAAYRLTANFNPAPRTGAVTVAGQTIPVTQAGILCAYALSLPGRTHGFGPEIASVGLTTSNLCPWAVSTTNSWITITSATNGTGSTNLIYLVASNTAPVGRTGVVHIAGQPFAVSQFGVPFLCASNKTVECGTPWSFDPPTPTGACGDTNGTLQTLSTVTNPVCGNTFSATRTWEATDSCSNRLLCVQVVRVVDTMLQVLLCATNKTVECGAAWNFDPPMATDSCAGTNVTIRVVGTVTNRTGFCGHTFSATRTWEAVDSCTNRVTCSQTVRLLDTTPPVITCVADKTAECGTAWTFNAPTATDSCGGTNVALTVLTTVTNRIGFCGNTFSATRTWEAVDSCTNRATCSQTVTVLDTAPPTLSCAANKTVECGSAWNFDPPTATDCGGTNVTLTVMGTVTNLIGACGNTFIATRTWEVSDGCGNRAACMQTVRVADTTPPALVCAANKAIECGTPWSFDPPTATDSCGGTNVTIQVLTTVTNTAGACGNTFTAVRTWEAVDSCTNRITCAQTVRVVDTTPPLLACVPNKTVECGTAWVFDPPMGTDSCGGTNVTLRVVSTATNALGACGNTFVATRVWDATDGCTNRTMTCTQVVTVVDTTPPTLTCATNKTAECGQAWTFNAPTATDHCGGTNVAITVLTTVTNRIGFCGNTYAATRTWEAVDSCTNRATCSQTVTVLDTTPPALSCAANKTVECGSAWNFDPPTATDCGGTNVTLTVMGTVTNLTGACGNTFIATRTWEVSDGCGNRAACMQAVRVADTTPPTLTCAANKTIECGTPWSFDPPTATDSCGGTNVTIQVLTTVTNTAGACGHTFTAVRTWEAVDSCTNRITCAQTVRVVDTAPPLLACVPNKTVGCGTAWVFDPPMGTDSCGGTNVTLRVVSTETNALGACGNTFVATRVWDATDGCTNRSQTCTQVVTVVDTTPPTLTCATNKNVECGQAWSFDAPTASDSCGGNVTVQVLSTVINTLGFCGNTFSATRTWEAMDSCSNRSTCSQTVRVVDTTPPTITCVAGKTVECGTAWSFDPPTASDTCSGAGVTIQVVGTVTNGTCGNTYTATRTWEALDSCTNRSTCSQTVRVLDTSAPMISCAANKTVEAGLAWSFDAPTATDSCGNAGLTFRVVSTVTNTAGACGRTFTATRTWEVSDGCSNRSTTCSQIVRVVDATPPALTCAGHKTVRCSASWTFDAPTVSDLSDGTNVTLTILSTVTNGSCPGGFIATRTWRATDSCTNSATCSQIVTGAQQVTIAGTVWYATNYPPANPSDKRLGGVTMNLTGATNLTTQSAGTGTYSFTFDPAGNCVVTPNLTNSSPVANGVSTVDISLVRRHVLAIATLDSPYKLLAADVNGSRSVTTLDISFMRRLILGATNSLPAGLWRFVPADYSFPNALSPWDAPSHRSYASVQADFSGQDFVAIKLGDVNNSWTPPVAPAGLRAAGLRAAGLSGAGLAPAAPVMGPEVTFQVSFHTNQPMETVVARVTVSGFRQVTSAQYTLAWDPAVLQFAGTGGYGLAGLAAGNFGLTVADGGNLAFSWDDPAAQGVTLADGTTIFTVSFDVIGRPGSVSPLALVDAATPREVGVNFMPASLRAQDGQVTIIEPTLPQLARAVYTNGVFGVPLSTLNGKRYILEYTDSLSEAHWTALPPITGDGTVKILVDPAANVRQRFYRVRVE